MIQRMSSLLPHDLCHGWSTSLWSPTRNTGLDEAQAGIKVARRNINNLRYADDTTLMAESEELKSLLMKVKEESEKVGFRLNALAFVLPASYVEVFLVVALCLAFLGLILLAEVTTHLFAMK